MCDSSCTMRTCSWLQILFGVLFGVGAALAYYCVPCLAAEYLVFLMFGLSVLAIIGIAILIACAVHSGLGHRSCLCGCGKSLLWAAFGTLIFSLMAMFVSYCCHIAMVILFGLTVAFFAALITALWRTLSCEIGRLCDRPRTRCRECDEEDEDFRR